VHDFLELEGGERDGGEGGERFCEGGERGKVF